MPTSICRNLCVAMILWGLVAISVSTGYAQDDAFRIDPSAPTQTKSGDVAKVEPPFTATFVEDREQIAIIQVSGNYDQKIGDTFNSLPRQEVAQEFYRHHPDDYDFLFIFTTFEYDTGTATAFHVGVQNQVQGIGLDIFDLSASMGSDGRLLGLVEMSALERYDLAADSVGFEDALVTMSHELMHQWCCYTTAESASLLGRDGFHWSYLLDSDASVMYGSAWRDQGDGTWTATATERFYSPLDLYLAGFYGADEVPPFLLLENPAIDATLLPSLGDTIEATASQLDIATIIASEGPRLPEARRGQELRGAFLLLTREQEPLQEAHLHGIDVLRRELATRFAVLTGGRGLLRVLPAQMPGQGGQPTTTTGGDVRPPEQFDLEAAFAWLRSQQTTQGYWQDRPGTRLRDTTVALELLSLQDPTFEGVETALAWLDQQETSATDYLARTSRSLDASGTDAASLRTELSRRQRSDGGWGFHDQHRSDAIDTALALDALFGHDDADPAALDAAVQFLIGSQGADGGWGPVPGAPGRTGATTTVLRTLSRMQRHDAVAGTAIGFLAARQNPGDGGFGDSPSTSHDTASVLETLDLLDRRDAIDEIGAEAYLRQRQGIDGSWDGGVYATARAIAALKGQQQADLLIDSVVAAPLQPSDGQRVQLDITLRNGGSIAAGVFQLVLYEGPPSEATEVSRQTLQGLDPGQTVSLDLSWDSTDRSGSRQLSLWVDAEDAIRESDENNNTSTVGIEVLEAPLGVDLAIIPSDVLIRPENPDRLPSEVAFSALVHNLGRTPATDVEVRLWAGEADSGQLLAVHNVPLLADRSSVVANFVYPLQTAEPPSFTFEVASPESEDEVDNNRASIVLTLDPTVDLALDGEDLQLDPNPALLGSLATFSAEIHNFGTLTTPSTDVVFRLSDGVTSQELNRRSLVLEAGQSTVETVTWNVNQLGELTFSAHLDEDGLVPERDEDNNQASLIFNTTDVAVADLVIDQASSPGDPVDGEQLALAVTVSNQGGITAPANLLRLFDGNPDATASILAEVTVPSLLAGQHAEFTVEWDTFGQVGSHTLTLEIDSAGTVTEVDETNNRVALQVTVSAPPTEAEIYLPADGLSIDPSEVTALPSPLLLQSTLRNLGLNASDPLILRWWQGDPDSGILLAEQSDIALAARSDRQVSFAYDLETSGETRFSLEVLTTSTGDDPSNNIASGQVTTVQGIDLRFGEPVISAEPDPAFIGHDVRFSVAIQNHGTVDSDTFQVTYLIDDGNERREIRSLATAVAAGATVQQSFLWRVDRLGPLTLEVDIDASQLIAERHEDNNLASLSFSALDVTEPDLALDLSQLVFSPEPGLEGAANTLSTTLHNVGGGDAADVLVTFYDGNPDAGGVEIDSLIVASLPVGAATPISVTWNAVPDPANRQIYVMADPLNEIAEPNESNNLTLRELQVLSLPDLAVSPLSLALDPPFPIPGDAVTLTLTTANLGEQSTGPFAVRIFLGDPAFGGQPAAADQSLTLEGLADGQSVFSFSLPTDVDAVTLVAQVDADHGVTEGRENNNQVELPLAFQSRDFFVTERYFSPDGDGIKDTTRFFFQLPSPHTVSVQVTTADGEVVRTHSRPEWTLTGGSSFEWNGLDDLGRVVDDGVHNLQVLDEHGVVLGQSIAETDTNRSLLIYAAGNEFSRYTNLTCNVRDAVLRFSTDEATVFLAVEAGSSGVATGVYRMRPDGSSLLPLASFGALDEHFPVALEVAPAGNLLAVEAERVIEQGVVSHKIFVLSPQGQGFTELIADARLIGFSPSGEVIAVTTTEPVEILAIEPATDSRRLLLSFPAVGTRFAADLAPDRSHLLVRNDTQRWLVGIEGGPARQLPDQNLCEVNWSGNSSLVVIPCAGSHGADVFNTDGELIINLPIPIEEYPQDILPDGLPAYPPNNWLAYPGEGIPKISWSEDDQELLMEVIFFDPSFRCGTGSYKALVHGDLSSGVSTIVARSLPQLPPTECNGEFLQGPSEPNKAFEKATDQELQVLPDIRHARWWIPEAGLALVEGFGVEVDDQCLAEGDCQLFHLFDEFDDFQALEFLPSGLTMLFASNDATLDPESPCFDPDDDHTDTWTLRSLLNLTTELRVEYDEEGDLELRGTAADLNLDRFYLEWTETPDDSTSWQLIAPPSGQPVVDDILVPWIPPYPGLFSVRLTVVDLAGNRQQVVEQVSSSQTPSIANVFLTPYLFSATGSSPIDTTEIFYDVLQPVVLNFRFLDTENRLVRSLVRVHGETASGQSVLWDGRNEEGQPVADGLYRVLVQNVELVTEVDSTPPQVAVRFSAPTSKFDSCEFVAHLGSYRLSGAILDPDRRQLLRRAAFQRGRLDDDRSWQDLGINVSFFPEAAPFIWTPVLNVSTDVHSAAEVVEQQIVYRGLATDFAGNSTSMVALPERHFLLEGIGLHVATDDGFEPLQPQPSRGFPQPTDATYSRHLFVSTELRLAIAESVAKPLSHVFVETRSLEPASGGTQPWQSSAVSQFLIPGTDSFAALPSDHRSEFLWSAFGQPVRQQLELRVRGIDLSGGEWVSNSSVIVLEPVELKGPVTDADLSPEEPLSEDLLQLLDHPAVDLGNQVVVWGLQNLPYSNDRVVLEVQSNDDPQFTEPRRFEVTVENSELFVVALDGLLESATYRFEAIVVRSSCTGGDMDAVSTGSLPLTPEMGLVVETFFEEAACGEFTARAQLSLTARATALVELESLEIFALGEQGTETSLFVEPQPLSGNRYDWTTPLSFPLQNDIRYRVRLSGSERLTGRPLPTTIEDILFPAAGEAPQLVVHQPTVGELICLGRSAGPPLTLPVIGTIPVSGEFQHRTSLLWTDFFGLDIEERFEGGSDPLTPFEPDLLGIYEGNGPRGGGTATVRLKVGDDQGRFSCLDTPVVIDNSMEPVNVLSEHSVFSPNGDGTLDHTTLNFVSGEPASLTMAIYRASGNPNAPIEGQILRTLLQDVQVDGQGSVPWDGTAEDGQVLADGTYAVASLFRDACGHVVSVNRFLEIDNTPPEVAITEPQVSVGLGSTVQVLGEARDHNFANYSLDVSVDDGLWTHITTATHPVAGTTLGSWLVLDGTTATLRLTATDRGGNSNQALQTVTIEDRGDLITFFEAVPTFFSPNDDGRLETTVLRFALSDDVLLDLSLDNAAGDTVATLIDGQLFSAGSDLLPWDGTASGSNVRFADGSYLVKLMASLPGTSIQQQEELAVELDATPPQVALSYPEDGRWLRGNESVVGTVSDLHLESYTLFLENLDEASQIVLASGNAERQDEALAFLDLGSDGDYELLLQATDLGESRAQTTVAFQVDTVPPIVSLESPAEGSLLGVGGGLVDIRGSIDEEHLASYRLEAVPIAAAGGTRLIASSESLPQDALLSQWDLEGIPDGTYQLRLVAEDLAGWQSAATVTIEVDSTPPALSVTAPQADLFITEAIAILGSATDPHFDSYSLAVAPAGQQQFSEIYRQSNEVSDGLLADWQLLPPDGAYLLRLQAVDSLGNTSQLVTPVRIDVTPPASPLGLVAELIDDDSARLQWSPVNDPDLVGYRLLRGAVPVTQQPITATQWVDDGLSTGTHVYTVVAVDQAALESAPSNSARVTVDLDAPFTRLHVPEDAARVHGIVEVIGTAFSPDDFKEYRLSVAATPAGTVPQDSDFSELRRSPVPIQLDTVGQWSTLGLSEESLHTLRLEGEDIHGNQATHEVRVVVDNQPPSAPSGLAAGVDLDTIQLTWNANSESDLLGYLLYRDGQLANADSSTSGSLLPFVIPPAGLPGVLESYLDAHRPDGTNVFHVQAIDQAENVSSPSSSIEVIVETGPPTALISTPEAGHRFDQPLYVRATAVDHDVATVQLQFRLDGDTQWDDLAPLDLSQPWDTTWQLDSVSFGTYELRAVATDDGGLVDEAPASIQVFHQDTTPPEPVSDLQIDDIDGGQVDLSWSANTVDSDLAGYVVDRRDGEGVTVRLTATPITNVSYSDTSAPDGGLVYTVSTLDSADNISSPSNEAEGRVFTPYIEPIPTPTPQTQIDLTGSVPPDVAPADISVLWVSASGNQTLPNVTTDSEGGFQFDTLELPPGNNSFTVLATNPQGHRSRPTTFDVEVIARPTPPIWIEAIVTGNDVDLSWLANPEPDLVGYILYRDGERLGTSDPIALTQAAASSTEPGTQASNVLDPGNEAGNPRWTSAADAAPVTDQWLEVIWTEAQPVAAVNIFWSSRIRDFDLEVWQAGTWVKVGEARNSTAQRTIIPFDLEIVSQRLRVRFRSAESQAGIFDIKLFASSLTVGTHATDTAPDGTYNYTLEALGESGFVSDPSLPLEVLVGDGPPPPVVLSGSANGSTVELGWTASSAENVDRYEVYRDGQRILTQRNLDQLTHDDNNRANGTYIYQVLTFDDQGQQSASNALAVTVAVETPPAPLILSLEQGDDGRSLELTWQPGSGLPTHRYLVSRSTAAGGPYTDIRNTSSLFYRDGSVVIDQTYFYVVRGLDTLGNRGTDSNEVSGTLEVSGDLPTPQLTTPRLDSGAPFETLSSSTTIRGTIDSDAFGLRVHLLRDGQEVRSSSVQQSFVGVASRSEIDATSLGDTWTSGDGAWTAIMGTVDAPMAVYEWSTGTEQSISGLSGEPRWFHDHQRMVFANDGQITTYNVNDGSQQLLLQLTAAELAVPSPDDQSLAVVGLRDGVEGLWTVDLNTQVWTLQVTEVATRFKRYSVQWSPDGQWLVYRLQSPRSLELINVVSGERRFIEDASNTTDPSWAPDSSEITYISRVTSSSRGIYRYLLANDQTLRLTNTSKRPRKPRYSADGTVIGYWQREVSSVSPGDNLRTIQVDGSGDRFIYDANLPSGKVPQWDWIGSQSFFTYRDPSTGRMAALRLGETGLFAFSAPLVIGDNIFTAVADDTIGRVSALSEPLEVRRLSNMSDLEITSADIQILPTVPRVDEASRIAVTVRNVGDVTAPVTALQVGVTAPDGSASLLADGLSVPSLDAGESTLLLFDYVPTLAGLYAVDASADVDDELTEVSETNNRAIAVMQVVADTTPILELATERLFYGTQEDVRIDLEIFNPGDTFDGQVDVVIEDANGFIVTSLESLPIDDLAFGGTWTANTTWNTADTFAGLYRIQAFLTDDQGESIVDASTAITLLAAGSLEAELNSDRLLYILGETVRLDATIRYPQGNQTIEDGIAVLSLLDPNGQEVTSWTQPLGTLLPGTEASLSRQWSSTGALEGTYEAQISVQLDGTVVAGGTTSFELTDEIRVLELTAEKTVAMSFDRDESGGPSPGDQLRYEITLHNRGSLEASQVVILDTLPETVSLVAGSITVSHGAVTSTSPLRVDIPGLEPGTSGLVTFEVEIADSLPAGATVLANQAEIHADGINGLLSDDPTTLAAADPTQITVVVAPLLRVSKGDLLLDDRDGNDVASPGDVLRYHLTIFNEGTAAATALLLEDALPQHTTLVAESVTLSAGTIDLLSEDYVAVQLDELAPRTSFDVNFDVEIAAALPGGVVQLGNQALLSSAELAIVLSDDPDRPGDSDVTRTPLVAAPSLQLDKTVTVVGNGSGSPEAGSLLEYQLLVHNSGSQAATGLLLHDVLPEFALLLPETLQLSAGVLDSLDPLVASLSELAAGDSWSLGFQVQISEELPPVVVSIANQATLSSFELADLLSDDPATTASPDPTVVSLDGQPGVTALCEVDGFTDSTLQAWQVAFLGDATAGGATVVDERLQLTANGSSLYHGNDNGVFVYQPLDDNDDVRIEVDVTGFPVDAGGPVHKAALMLRSHLGAQAPRVMVTYVPQFPNPVSRALQFDFRAFEGDSGQELANNVFDVPGEARLAIEKRGDHYAVYYSIDGGNSWLAPQGAGFNGQVDIDLGAQPLVGMMATSYDDNILMTAEFDDFALCRPPGGGPTPPPTSTPCDPVQPLDLVFVLDLSGSMTANYPQASGQGAMTTRLQAAQEAIDELVDSMQQAADGSRAALVTFAGFRTPAENLAAGTQVQVGLTDDLQAVADLASSFSVAGIDPGTTTPTSLALAETLELLMTDGNPEHQPVVVLITDGIPNIDSQGRGPDAYELEELQAISLTDANGRFLSWPAVGWLGNFNPELPAFDGETLANSMFEIERSKLSLPELLIYGVALQGDGVGLGTFNQDLLDYAAYFSGARSFGASNAESLSVAIGLLATDLDCGGLGTASLGDRVWQDLDGDGAQDLDEPGINGVSLDLFDSWGFGITRVTTEGDGEYSIDELPAGDYSVQIRAESLPPLIDVPTWDVDGTSSIDLADISLSEGESRTDVDFGYQERPPSPPTTLCEDDLFADPLLADIWQLTELGDAQSSEATITDGELWLRGDGSSLFHGTDNAALLYQEMAGDGRIEVDVTGFPVDQGGAVRKACLMVRSGLDPLDARVMACFIPHLPGPNAGDPESTALQFDVRHNDGVAEELATLDLAVPLPIRLAIERRGDIFTVLYSRDGGLHWIHPLGQLGGQVEVAMGETLLAGVAVASYDTSQTVTASFDHWSICRPSPVSPFEPLPAGACDAQADLDVIYLLDLSSSMTAPMDDGSGGTSSRLNGARQALLQLHGMVSASSGRRTALVGFRGHDAAQANLDDNTVVLSPLSIDSSQVEGQLLNLDASLITADTETPTALALRSTLQLLLNETQGAQPVVVLITDGVPNIDGLGLGPYDLEAVQAVSLRNNVGDFLAWGEVAWQGDFVPDLGTFSGEPLAHAMAALEESQMSLGGVRFYAVTLEGNGSGQGTFHRELAEYAAFVSGGLAFTAEDLPALETAIDALGQALTCEGGE